MPQQSFLSRTAVVLLLLVVSACLISSFAWETSASAVPRRHSVLQRRTDDYTHPSSDELSSDFAVDEIDTSTTPDSTIPETASSIASGDEMVDYGDEAVDSGVDSVDYGVEAVDSGDEVVGDEAASSGDEVVDDEDEAANSGGEVVDDEDEAANSGAETIDYEEEAVSSGDGTIDSDGWMVGITALPSTTFTSTAMATAVGPVETLSVITHPAVPSSAAITYGHTIPAGGSIPELPKTTLGGYGAASVNVDISKPTISTLQGNGATSAGTVVPKPSASALEDYEAAPAGTTIPKPSISVLTEGNGVTPAGGVDSEPSTSVHADGTAAPAGDNGVDPLEFDNEGGGTAPAGGPTPQPSVIPTAITGTEPVAGVNTKPSIVPSALDELTPEQQESVKDFTAAMCAEVPCDYSPSDVCPDAANDPCIKVDDALKSPTFTETYETAKKKVAAEEEERKKTEDEDGGNDGEEGKDGNGGDDDSDNDNGDDDDDDHLGRDLGLGLGLGVPAGGAIAGSAYGEIAGKAWWPPRFFKPKDQGNGSQAPDPKPNPEPGPQPNPGPGNPPTPATPQPPVKPPKNVDPPINYNPTDNVEGDTDKDPEQEEEGAWKQSPSSPHNTLRQSHPRRGSGVDSTPSSLPAPGFSPFRRYAPRSLRPLFADHRRRAGLADCQGELMRKNQEFNELKTKYDKLEKEYSQEGASDYNKVKQDLRDWQDAAQKAVLEQDRIKKDLTKCQDTLKKIEIAEPDGGGKGKDQASQIKDLERKVTSLEAAKHAGDLGADKCREHETQMTQDLTKCNIQKEGYMLKSEYLLKHCIRLK